MQADLTCAHAVTCLRAFAQEPGACSVARESLHDSVCEAAGSGGSGAAPAAFSAHHIIEGSSFSSGGVSSSSLGTPVLSNTCVTDVPKEEPLFPLLRASVCSSVQNVSVQAYRLCFKPK